VSGAIVVLATRNPGKLRELQALLSRWRLDLRSLDDIGFRGVLEEPGPGYTESALAKATAVCIATDLPALADDSGIEIDALRGWPGPMSARWLGEQATDEDRLLGLIAEVERQTPDDPRARYVCVAALARPVAEPVTAHGECLGTIVSPPRGTNGFGYDPAFLSADLGVTFAEATEEDKARVSHRARAIARMGDSGVFETAPFA
jgi:XTP/dITP diphosphohydrolase